MAIVLAVCGLAVEARIAMREGVRAVAGGGHAHQLADAIEREIAGGVAAVISFGIAGSLSPSLAPGAVLVATEVVDGDTRYPTDPAWSSSLRQRIADATSGPIAGSDAVVVDRVAKERLHAATRAVAVDMESHVAARLAARHELPFAVLRTIADPLARTLPPAATIALRSDGRVDLGAVLRSLARSPGQLPQLMRVALDTRSALSALGRGGRLLGRGLGYADLDQLLLHVV